MHLDGQPRVDLIRIIETKPFLHIELFPTCRPKGRPTGFLYETPRFRGSPHRGRILIAGRKTGVGDHFPAENNLRHQKPGTKSQLLHGLPGSGPITAGIGIVCAFEERPDTVVISFQVRLAAEKLHKGGIIACPTESVYGLSCDPLNQSAIERLLALKQRPDTKGFILIASNIEQLEPFVNIPDDRREEIERSWPGPITWVLPAKADLPPWIGGGRSTIAARVTAHAQMAAICDLYGGCLVSTSANISGQPPARNPVQVRRQFDDLLDMIVGGKLGGLARPTPIRDAVSGKFIRR